MITIPLFLLGCLFLWKGADWLVDGANGIGSTYKINPTVLGLTLVAFGTSAPELIVSVFASLSGNNDIVFGNIIGSNVANTLLILGTAALICPVVIHSRKVFREVSLNFLVSLLLLAMISLHVLTPYGLHPIELGILGLIFVYFMGSLLKKEPESDIDFETTNTPLRKSLGWFGLGCLLLPLGGHFVITSATQLATQFGLSQSFISIFAIALGTSLPELVTTVVASLKKQVDLAVGNVLGSNLFNILFVLVISGVINPIQVSPVFRVDLIFLSLTSFYLWFMLVLRPTHTLKTWNGIICLVMYASYIGYCFAR